MQTAPYDAQGNRNYSVPFVPAAVDKHVLSLELSPASDFHPAGKRFRNTCPCGFNSAWLLITPRRQPQERPNGCPYDPTVWCLSTLQFASGGLFDAVPVDYLIHLIRMTNLGTPGPTLCRIDRFAPGSAGWSRGGGVTGPNIVLKPCTGCADAARADFPGLPIWGSVGAKEMAAHLGVGLAPWRR